MELKFCVDCTYYISTGDCSAPEHGVDLVTGKPQLRRCVVQRSKSQNPLPEYCGEHGLFFQPKATIPEQTI